jgi:hypothetical protein
MILVLTPTTATLIGENATEWQLTGDPDPGGAADDGATTP